MKKKSIPYILARSVMIQYEGAKTRDRADSELSEEFDVEVAMYLGSAPSPFHFAVVVDFVTELARDGVISELLYVDDLVLMSDIIEGLRNKNKKHGMRL